MTTTQQKSKRKGRLTVAVVTGTRAEFGIWRPVIAAIQQSDALTLRLIVTGMHLLASFGDTVKEIEGVCTIDARAAMYRRGESPEKSLGRGIESLAAAYRETKPDVVFLLGDRLEMLAAASAALAARIPIAHLHGGETAPGVWDEQIRHAITKMAHLHFCSTETAGRRIVQMGEDPRRVYQAGAPALDMAESFWRMIGGTVQEVRADRRQKKRGDEAVLLLHPSGGSDAEEHARTCDVLHVLRSFNIPFSTIGPNNDPGHEGILEAYRQEKIDVEMSVPQERFWHLLGFASVLIGNSSAGIIEAASFGVPVVNIGDRQKGRERNPNVVDVPWSRAAIEKAVRKTIVDEAFLKVIRRRKNLYGDGRAAERIVSVLESFTRTGVPLAKTFHDL